ncbi:Putative GTPase PH0274 [Geodia barretti]|uniref:GTPase PH0274 n=1 Tax=Geodia barretti TaxID=519541 RepID=A0AA35W7I5_GEOBA|nr:Putative GTPase PH0274 [Geodia barretti]
MNDDVARVLGGDQRAISRMMTALERRDSAVAPVIKELDCKTGNAYTIGITGPPGVGKSTLVDRFTGHLRDLGLTVGIIAVDPDSPFSGGSILGDRIRMQRHYLDSGVFIRSVSTRGQGGGLPRIVKRYGVGQTELGIMTVADTVVVALMPESGDAIQTLKAGILEIADIYIVNKSDREGADRMAAAMRAMLQIASEPQEWEPPVLLTQADRGLGIEELWEKVKEHRSFASAPADDLGQPSLLEKRRSDRRRAEFLESIQEELNHRLKARIENDPTLRLMLEDIAIGKREPFSTAAELLEEKHIAGFTFLSGEGESLP